tara:strand:+ start:2061 stop:2321 length:261 start_codon:yes stop_codon:yes gene_type:complete
MGKIYRFPEPAPRPAGSQREVRGPGELVAIRGDGLETTLEMVGFLRSLANQSYLDRYNRVAEPRAGAVDEGDQPDEDARPVPEERR